MQEYNYTITKTFMKDKFVHKIFSNVNNLVYVKGLIMSIPDIASKDIENIKILTNDINEYKYIEDKKTDAIFELDNNMLVNIEANAVKSLKNIYKNFQFICHMVLKVTDKSNKSIKKIIQINLNCFDRYGDDKFLYKTVLCEVSSHKQYFDLIEIDDINLDFLRKRSYDELMKFAPNSLEYLTAIFVNVDKSMYDGDEMMQSIIREIDDMSKDINEIIYYDPIELENDNIYEMGLQKGINQGVYENKQDIAKSMIKKEIAKKLVIECTGITEKEYLKLYEEVNK